MWREEVKLLAHAKIDCWTFNANQAWYSRITKWTNHNPLTYLITRFTAVQ